MYLLLNSRIPELTFLRSFHNLMLFACLWTLTPNTMCHAGQNHLTYRLGRINKQVEKIMDDKNIGLMIMLFEGGK
jgi:hypothetical protein